MISSLYLSTVNKVILSTRNKIRLSKTLHAQTTPYPRMKTWAKRAASLSLLAVIAFIYLVARPEKPTASPEPKEILGEQDPPPGQPAELETYTVKKGDTLFNVSQKYNLSWQTLAEINNLSEPYLLKIGQKLK